MNLFSSLQLGFLFDALLPPRKTERAVRALTPEVLMMLKTPGGALPYHEARITAFIWEIKYRRNALALRLAGEFLAEDALAIAEECLSKPTLIPVPMHKARKKERGYNQTELLCEAIMQAAPNSFLYAPNAVVRMRNTRPQQGLPRHQRLLNIHGAMEVVKPEEVAGKTCIVIDDVSTTGATAHETKRVLIEAGAREVHILTLAHS
jgi:competence protein ComFC